MVVPSPGVMVSCGASTAEVAAGEDELNVDGEGEELQAASVAMTSTSTRSPR